MTEEPAFLLDSNICIYLLEGLSEVARDRVERCAPGEVVTSAVVYAEVLRGIDKSDPAAMTKIESFFAVVKVLPFDGPAALAYSRVPFKRRSFDRLIAAHALSLGLIVATNNIADFDDVPGIKVENWAQA